MTEPEIAHAAKKLLCCGIRGHKSKLSDLQEIIQALERAIEFETILVGRHDPDVDDDDLNPDLPYPHGAG